MSLEHRWVSCSLEVSIQVSRYRHLLALHHGSEGTVVCGATGLGPGVWRNSKVKPDCPECLKRAAIHGIHIPIKKRVTA